MKKLPLEGRGCCTPSEHPGVWTLSLGVGCSSNFNCTGRKIIRFCDFHEIIFPLKDLVTTSATIFEKLFPM